MTIGRGHVQVARQKETPIVEDDDNEAACLTIVPEAHSLHVVAAPNAKRSRSRPLSLLPAATTSAMVATSSQEDGTNSRAHEETCAASNKE